jgi:hypothetical protein
MDWMASHFQQAFIIYLFLFCAPRDGMELDAGHIDIQYEEGDPKVILRKPVISRCWAGATFRSLQNILCWRGW